MNAESSSESSDDIDSQMYASVLQDLKSKKVEDTPYYSTLLKGTKDKVIEAKSSDHQFSDYESNRSVNHTRPPTVIA